MRSGHVALACTLLLACAGQVQVREVVARPMIATHERLHVAKHHVDPKTHTTARAAKEPDVDELLERDFSGRDVAPPVEEKAKAPEREPDVEGIEGTMSEFDVRVALDERDEDFNRCHDEHRGGSGRIVFRIHVLANGDVGDVKAHASRVRNKDIIECYTQVVSSTHFTKPHGGYADVKWTTKVGRSKKKQPDAIYDRPHRFDAPASEPKPERSASSEGRHRRKHRHHHSRKHHKRG